MHGNADRELVDLARDDADGAGDAIASWAPRKLGLGHTGWPGALPCPVMLTADG